MKRLLWLDISKGLAILVVAYFHFFRTYFEHGTLPPADWSGLAASALTILRLVWLKVSGLGFHAVGVFIILSGWTLMQATVRRAESGAVAWGGWYRARFLRLYPMYWVAHLVYLLSPFVARLEPVDSRIVLSLLFYPAALQFYHGATPYVFVDFATGTCCMLEIVGIAGFISLFNGPVKLFGLVGLYSYGLYLIHQPYVIWLGLRIREQPIWMFLLIAVATLAVLSAWGMLLEKATHALVNKLVSARKTASGT